MDPRITSRKMAAGKQVEAWKHNQLSLNFFALAEAIIRRSTCESIYSKDCEFCLFLLTNDFVQTHCYVVDNSELILMSIYKTNSINNNWQHDMSTVLNFTAAFI